LRYFEKQSAKSAKSHCTLFDDAIAYLQKRMEKTENA